MKQTIVEMFYVARDPAWAPWAVQYFFLIGLSVGSFLLTLPGLAFGRPGWKEAGRVALLGALVCGLAAPVALLSDLHNPGRFLNFYLHPQPGSWMSWGSFFLVAYTGLLPVYAWAALAPAFRAASGEDGGVLAKVRGLLGGVPRPGLVLALGLLTFVAASLVALYTGMEVMIVRARPLWNTSLLPFEMFATALAGATGLTLVLERAVGAREAATETLLNRVLAIVLAVVAALGVWWYLRALGGQGNEAIALSQIAGSRQWGSYALWAILGVGAPLLVAALRPRGTSWLTGLLAVQAAWAFRWILFVGGQDMPKTGGGLYQHAISLGPDGWTGIVGTAGLWLVIFIALTTLLPWSAARSEISSSMGA